MAVDQLWREYCAQHNKVIQDWKDGKITASDREAYLDDLYFEYKKAKGLI